MARGIAAIGECMLELSGQNGDQWRLGYAGDTFNTLWALRALTGGTRDTSTTCPPMATIRSRPSRSPSSKERHRHRAEPGHPRMRGRASTRSH